jgi:hypothetical protein
VSRGGLPFLLAVLAVGCAVEANPLCDVAARSEAFQAERLERDECQLAQRGSVDVEALGCAHLAGAVTDDCVGSESLRCEDELSLTLSSTPDENRAVIRGPSGCETVVIWTAE